MEKPQGRESTCGFFASGENLRFRPMTMADIDEIMVIERSAYRFPWSQGFFLQELQVTCARSILAEADGKIVGYALYWLLPEMIDIHNLATHIDYRRRGIGRLLLTQILAQASAQLISRVTLEVRKSNSPAQRLYESCGFLTTGVRKGYYSDNGEDALAMTLDVPHIG
ncbi:MAG: ribosomal-protein-alanine N-acetyltransferase [Deltaproteobacteria bacterium]|nr:ribosomal-protein-alanine N-acetyltransferase [Deltaproteobacteria bacterium]